VKVDYTFTYQLQPQTGTLTKGDVQIGGAVAHLTGTIDNSGDAPSVKMKLVGDGMPAADLEAVLPALGVTLPSGASLKEGTLSTSLSIDGSVNHLVTTGPVKLSNAKLAGFDLGAKMGVLSSFAGIPKGADTVIQTLSTNVRVAPEGIQATNFDLVVPAIGAVTGGGTVAANQALDFKMVAHLTSSSNPIGSLASLTGGGKGNSGGIPFKIQGTSSNPTFIPDVGGMAAGIAKNVTPADVNNIGKQLGGLFGKKK
jgi:AsmA protein